MGYVEAIEYLKWKMNVTVDDMIKLSEMVVPTNNSIDDEKYDPNDDDIDSDDMDISLGDDGLFSIISDMEKHEEKIETEQLLKSMEIENEKKRIEHEKHVKQKQIED